MPQPDIAQVLQVLAEHAGGASLPRLAKRLDARASTLLRLLAPYGGDELGGQAGLGWIRIEQAEDGWTVHLADAGRAQLDASA